MSSTQEEDDILALLRAVVPLGPPPDLRERIFAAGQPSAWRWAAAAAALLIVTMALQSWTDRIAQVVRPSSPTASAVAGLTDLLGGGEEARSIAAWVVALEEMRAARNAPGQAFGSEVTP